MIQIELVFFSSFNFNFNLGRRIHVYLTRVGVDMEVLGNDCAREAGCEISNESIKILCWEKKEKKRLEDKNQP